MSRSVAWALVAAAGFAVATRPGPWGFLAWPAAVALHAALRRAPNRRGAAVAAGLAGVGPASVAVTPLAPLHVPGGLLALASIAASFGLAGAIARAVASGPSGRVAARRLPLWAVASVAWIGVEAAWGATWLLGDAAFPVVAIGTSLVDGPLRRLAHLGGAPVLGLALLLVSGAAEAAVHRGPRLRSGAFAAMGLLIAASGPWHGSEGPTPVQASTQVATQASTQARVLRLRLVQHGPTPTAIAAAHVDAEAREQLLAPLYASLEGADDRLVVWPETAWPLPLSWDGPSAGPVVGRASVLFGAVTHRDGRTFNSVLLAEGGALSVVADKVRPVPFTESALTAGAAGRTLLWRGVSLGAAVCWDAVFPGVARASVRGGADVLIFLADDSYASSGPVGRLHLRQARLRALETRRPVVLVQATGPSAAIAPDGRILASLPMGVRGHVDVDVPVDVPVDVAERWKGGGS